MSLTHASIVPLIGGETIGAHAAHGIPPEFFVSYTPFQANDKHILNYYNNEIPYYLLDQGQAPHKKVDVVHAVCPCAGLSRLSHGFGDHNENNKWLIDTTKYVLREMLPDAFWGENAPGFAGDLGKNIRAEMRSIAESAGYTMSVYKTKTLLHGGPQVRERSFYFFWRGNKTPLLNYYNKPYQRIEDVLLNIKSNFQTERINTKTPSIDDPYYRYILEEIHGGITHRDFFDMVEPESVRNANILMYIERTAGRTYSQVAEWMTKMGYEKEAEKCKRRQEKLDAGGNIMRRCTMVPKDYIGAFVGQYPTCLTHPHEDRYINYREAMTIMGMPDNFELVDASISNINHVCQNVPVQTATDMATEVVEALSGNRQYIDTKYILQNNHNKTHEIERSNNTLETFFE